MGLGLGNELADIPEEEGGQRRGELLTGPWRGFRIWHHGSFPTRAGWSRAQKAEEPWGPLQAESTSGGHKPREVTLELRV